MLLAAVSINGLMYLQGLKALSITHQSIRGILDMYRIRKRKNTTGTITSIKIFLNPFTLRAAQTGLPIFVLLFEQKAFWEKYLMEKCLPEVKQQLSFKYFLNFRFIPKLFLKV